MKMPSGDPGLMLHMIRNKSGRKSPPYFVDHARRVPIPAAVFFASDTQFTAFVGLDRSWPIHSSAKRYQALH